MCCLCIFVPCARTNSEGIGLEDGGALSPVSISIVCLFKSERVWFCSKTIVFWSFVRRREWKSLFTLPGSPNSAPVWTQPDRNNLSHEHRSHQSISEIQLTLSKKPVKTFFDSFCYCGVNIVCIWDYLNQAAFTAKNFRVLFQSG